MFEATTNDLILIFGVLLGMIVGCALWCYAYISSRRLETTDSMARCLERFAARVAIRDIEEGDDRSVIYSTSP